jgi:DNA-binding GntR family transcriptional regulator
VWKNFWLFPKKSFNLHTPFRVPRKRGNNIASPLNLNPMVQVETSQLTAECNAWRNSLRQHREEFTQAKAKLQQAASRPLSKDQLQEVEHLHNQFHIQLINIHDLKQAIKTNDRKINYEMNLPAGQAGEKNGQLSEETVAEHENLFDQFQNLELTLQEVRDEFNHFLNRTR